MLISLNELKKLVKITIPDEKLLSLIGSRLVEIESVDDWSKKYKNIYIVKVVSCKPIEGTHLHLCKIDAGTELNKAHSDEQLIQVVCGAPNVREGMFAVWIAPGAIVPSTSKDKEPFEISSRKLRGFMSHGMLAGADELALGEDHSGIVEIDPAANLARGTLFADAFGLNDKIIEVENKSLTHRPDCFGLVGFAREVAGILEQPFSEPKFKPNSKNLPEQSLEITISDEKICPGYKALLFELEKQPEKNRFLTNDDIFLFKAGMRPISPIVDQTNIIMLKTGQPLHAFDYDKFLSVGKTEKPEIGVRLARENETLVLLDNEEITLNKNDIVITSGDTPVALAGAKGGKSTEIDDTTKKIIIEIASFSLYNLRKTQMSHGIFSEAITRFTKGRPATDLDFATSETINSLSEKLGMDFLGSKEEISTSLQNPDQTFKQNVVKISTLEINSLLGSNYSTELITKTLENVGFEVKKQDDDVLTITVPLWRTDIHIKEDIIEEVGRLLGYDNLPLSFPLRPFICPTLDPIIELKEKIRSILSDRLEMNELLTYSFVSQKLQKNSDENVDDSYKIVNSISPELECFRQSLVPSLLEKARLNEKTGYKLFSLYEINQIAKKSFGNTEENVPKLEDHLGIVSYGDFYRMKQALIELFKSLHISFSLKPAEKDTILSVLEPKRSAIIAIKTKNEEIALGSLGELKSSVKSTFKLLETNSALEINLAPLLDAKKSEKETIKLSKFPPVLRDLTVRTKVDIPFSNIENLISSSLEQEKELIFKIEPISIFQKPNSDTKNLSFHLEISSEIKTLTSEEISVIMKKVTKNLTRNGAEIV